ncbi:carbamoyl-phosphate synthase (glutamine-hydrolyzing) large subunit [Sulfurisphaera ohwakuensis]|uniref:Carbamoyl phosphate synthase large chain n=1 Tax=Sulfurisphaera ohwakuensis TaxID=69656 RepID=A0A650CHR2_SULOH|nr:carbamoyl-phosphate synthase (glutamine-hydrolyzing) large subunit [Sulfurisphaera ohwakuensis]MBB5252322.1 carbamoyl-phosphate synthase large subunit [Sulfurisphaera ohwakuensis]QGR17215.1 carbamoyl-phosphate synthase (glutamine-hydrolyzing) large subunit [Sulfurisphaera ohwakuensis]
MRESVRKVLVIGSGPIKIAEAAEFDYSGSQALKALKEEGIETILVNSNVATVQTSRKFADKLYMIPVTWWAVEKVIERERPDGIMVGFGGQTALNVGVDLYNKGILHKYGVKVLGTPIEGIERALSREKFRETMINVGLPVPPSLSARSEEEALEKARQIGYPVMVRVSFNLGGRGSIVAWNEEELKRDIGRALSQSYIHEVLIEKYLHHWIELEYEVMRDKYGNSAVIACIENLDPMGVHTGESTVISPCQTLDNKEFQDMRFMSMDVAKSIDLVGECNVQFALDPKGYNYYVIETNPRMSRSSALASKATGYPLAYVSAKLALGYSLYEVLNKVSGSTCACFEPSLDYVVIKIPRWDLDKFENVEVSLASEMKSVGEVMSIGRSFEESLQKAVRMLDIGEPGVVGGKIYFSKMTKEDALKNLKTRRPYWFLYAAKAFKEGATIDEVYEVTGINKFFLNKIKALVEFYEMLRKQRNIDKDTLLKAKKLGFSDLQLAKALGVKENDIRKLREKWNIEPKVKQIDTLAGEWPAVTNYLYLTYNGTEDDIEFSESGNKLLIIGAGGFRIGVSVEFDWSVVSLLDSSLKYFNDVAILNYNPETVSTDWDIARKLYFDEISVERVLDLIRKEKFTYVATFTGGQIGNNISKKLEEEGIRLLGTSGRSVDTAEDREKFSKLLDKLGIKQPEWISARSLEEVKEFISRVGYPVLIRPSYVLSGAAMKIVNNDLELMEYLKRATEVSPEHPVVISKYLNDAIEAEIDAAGDGKGVYGVVIEHVEEAGVHSGDATMSIPYRKLSGNVVNKMKENVHMIVRELEIKGPFNVQFVIKNNEPYIIELNLRASRSMPFSSKVVSKNIISLALDGILNGFGVDEFIELKPKSWGVKSPQFSWAQLKGAYPFLGPEMKSTGEAASLGTDFYDALLKSWLSSSPNKIPNKEGIALVYGTTNVEYLKITAKNLIDYGMTVYTLSEASIGIEEKNINDIIELIKNRKVEIVVTDGYLKHIDYEVRRIAVDYNIPIILNGRLGAEVTRAFSHPNVTYYEISEYGAGI